MRRMKKELLQQKARDSARSVKTVLRVDQTVQDAMDLMRSEEFIHLHNLYLYVVDEQDHLLGVVGTRDLLQHPPETLISEITNTRVKTVAGSRSTYEALLLMQKFHLLAMPVVEQGKFLGVLDLQHYFDESLQLSSARERREIFQTLGLILEEGHRKSTWQKYRSRVPWILCNMFGGIACAIISDIYEIVLLKVIVLAMFIPLVLSLSESISMQAMTQSMHEMTRRDGRFVESLRYILHESKLFLLISVTCGSLVGFLSLFWGDGWGPAITISASIMCSVVVTAIIGAFVPVILHLCRLDPKIASGPIVLMFADVITTTIYLSLAFWWLIGG